MRRVPAKTPHSRRRVVSRIETSLRTTAHQLLTLSSTKESGCMHSLSVYCWYKVYGRPPASGQGAPTSNVLAPQCPPGSTSQRKRRTSSSPHVRSRKRALPHWGTAARVSSRWSFRCPCVSRFTMHRVIAMMLSSLPEDHRRFRFNLGV